MKKILLALSLCSVFLISTHALACSKPDSKPAIPDVETVVTAQMVKANNEVKAYVKAVEEYLGCAKLPRSQERQEVDDLKAFAEEFNVVVRAFKAKSGG